jgi:hypothetical protein
MLARLAHRLSRDHEYTATVALLCTTCVPFLLHARQSRYYALVMLAQVILLGGFLDLVRGARRSGALQLILALTLQFYSNYMLVPGNALALVLASALVFRRDRAPAATLILCLGAVALLAAPWLAYAQPWHQTRLIGLAKAGARLLYYLKEIHFHLIPFAILIIPAILLALRAIRGSRGEAAASLSPCGELNALCWLLLPCSLAILSLSPVAHFRYITPLIPPLMLLSGGILTGCLRAPIVRRILLGVLCLSNAVSIASAYPFRSGHALDFPMVRFLQGVSKRYESRFKDVVAFLAREANPDDTLFIFDPGFPLIFHTGMKVIDARLTHGRFPSPPPDWVFTESPSGAANMLLSRFPGPLLKLYRPMTISVHDTPRGDGRPDPHAHVHLTEPRRKDLLVYRLKEMPGKARGPRG